MRIRRDLRDREPEQRVPRVQDTALWRGAEILLAQKDEEIRRLRDAAEELIAQADDHRYFGNRPIVTLDRLRAALAADREDGR